MEHQIDLTRGAVCGGPQERGVDRKCSHGEYRRGWCLDHTPELVAVGNDQLEPNPGLFGKKTLWFNYCCGARMARYKMVRTFQCKTCGRQEDWITNYFVGYCRCCGNTMTLYRFL